MAPQCHDRCTYEKQAYSGHGMYEKGFGRCNICCKFIKTDVLRCYCCNIVLRRNARMSKYKKTNKIYPVNRY